MKLLTISLQTQQEGDTGMESFLDLVRSRRSIRRYEPHEVTDQMLGQVFEAVRWSPSWANTQCWDIVVVRDPDVKKQLQETIAPKNPATAAITGAPVVLALAGRLTASGYYNNIVTTTLGDWFLYDLGIATQSLCLAAHRMGLGTVIVGLFDHARAGAILKIPATHQLVTLIPIGFPAKVGRAPERRPAADFVHREAFGG